MSRNKLIMISTMMLTIVIVTGWLGDNRTAPASPVAFEKNPSPSNPALTMDASADSECLSMSDFMSHYPDATPDEVVEIEQCNLEIERAIGRDQADNEF